MRWQDGLDDMSSFPVGDDQLRASIQSLVHRASWRIAKATGGSWDCESHSQASVEMEHLGLSCYLVSPLCNIGGGVKFGIVPWPTR